MANPVSDFDQVQGLLGDKGRLLGTGNGNGTIVVEPRAAGDASTTTVSHSVDHGTYMDANGHVHAVLFDTVVTTTGPPFSSSSTIEILADQPIT
ncbi:hypothetical protein AB0C07_29865 [Actinoplanes missouriensis]|uniref:hypothetical protein n=1 Tax=Actinoplanes missouriensis TaxID=1866 RepID=UPI00340DD338